MSRIGVRQQNEGDERSSVVDHGAPAGHAGTPLAARMRPRTLDEFVGQEHIVGPGRLLRRAIQADQLSSLIFYGPPGSGKTTLARIIANTTSAHFITINAVLAGVKEIRAAVAEARRRRDQLGQRTILFIDEVHRFNKAQQDALLPWVENGTVILIGATTENPYFEVNKALVSRSRIFQLKPLTDDDLRAIARRALSDPERGYGRLRVRVDPEALDHLVNVANGDARALLNALELAVETTPPGDDGVIHITLAVAEESIQRRAVLYDKEGDAHFDTISAFIKSLRGSDPDAALYWLAKMVYAGEDPRFIFRRMLILASEDVGLADPNAIVVVTACAEAFDRVGLPEGQFHLAQAALYLATAPKSNSVMGYFDALRAVEREREATVPAHLKDPSRDRKGFGHGEGYRYPHAYREHWVAQAYLPAQLRGRIFYRPTGQGHEATLRDQVARRREEQLAALDREPDLVPRDVLTFGPQDPAAARWLQRTLSQVGRRLGDIRDALFERAGPERHHVVLVLNAGDGLLVWEAVRRTPEGGVFATVASSQEEEALRAQATMLPELERPTVVVSPPERIPNTLARACPEVRFDRILGRNVLRSLPPEQWPALLRALCGLLLPGGRLILAESVPRRGQRLHQLVPWDTVPEELRRRAVEAEEAVYAQEQHWDVDALRAVPHHLDVLRAEVEVQEVVTEVHVTPALMARWFQRHRTPPSYADHLARALSPEEISLVEALFAHHALNRTVAWTTTIAFVSLAMPEHRAR